MSLVQHPLHRISKERYKKLGTQCRSAYSHGVGKHKFESLYTHLYPYWLLINQSFLLILCLDTNNIVLPQSCLCFQEPLTSTVLTFTPVVLKDKNITHNDVSVPNSTKLPHDQVEITLSSMSLVQHPLHRISKERYKELGTQCRSACSHGIGKI